MHIVGSRNRSPLLIFSAFFLLSLSLVFSSVLVISQTPPQTPNIPQVTYTAGDIFVELLEVRREQSMSNRVGSSIRFSLINPMLTEEEFEFEREELLEGIAEPSSEFDMLVKNTTLKEIVVQNRTFIKNITTHTQTFPNGTISWSETKVIQADGNPPNYTKFVDSGWINVTEIEDGKVKAKLKLKPNERIEILYITYFERQLGLNKRDVIPVAKVSNQTYKRNDWAVTFENYNKVVSIKTNTNVTNATIWVELQDVEGLDPSVDYQDNCQDIRVTNNNNDTVLNFGIGTVDKGGCQTANNRTQIVFRAPLDMHVNPVHLWFNDSAVTNQGNVTLIWINQTFDVNETGWSSAGTWTWNTGPNGHLTGATDEAHSRYFHKNSTLNPVGDKKARVMAKTFNTNAPNVGGTCYIGFGMSAAPSFDFFGTGFTNANNRIQGWAGASDGVATSPNVMYVLQALWDGSLGYTRAILASNNQTNVTWQQTHAGAQENNQVHLGFGANNFNCFYDDFMVYNETEEFYWYNTTFTTTLSSVYTVGGGGPSTYISETDGRDAIVDGIRNALGSSVPIYTDQQTYVRLTNTSQYLGRFDKATRLVNQIWAFNYITGSQTLANVPGVGNSLNVLEIINRTTKANVTSDVQNFITSTRIS